MSYLTYRLIHLFGILVLVVVVTLLSSRVDTTDRWRKPRLAWLALVGCALVVLTGGFGMLARLSMLDDGVPVWAQIKAAVLLALLLIALAPKREAWTRRAALCAIPLLGVAAAVMALLKPLS